MGLLLETATGLRRIAGPRVEQDYRLPSQSLDVLVRLARSPGGRLRMSDLAAQTALTPSGLTRAVDRLTDAGLVDRETCPEDRRGAFASLTPVGAERMQGALHCHREHLETVLEGVLTTGERALLVAMLRRLRDRVNPGAARVCVLSTIRPEPVASLSDKDLLDPTIT
jgi:MarR family 2-MHQ and catechol resistance regulon transcriptional repressor